MNDSKFGNLFADAFIVLNGNGQFARKDVTNNAFLRLFTQSLKAATKRNFLTGRGL
ncbi:hypothetical protein D3C72_2394860 [compost metagenome]